MGGGFGVGADDRARVYAKGQGMAKVVIGKIREGIAEVARVIGWGDESLRGGNARIV